MCGIVGYVGKNNCVDYILDGLKHLEYRGYDSAGIAIQNKNSVKIIKECGKINELVKSIEKTKIPQSSCAIGHTRWATHGKPNKINAHPIKTNNVTIVHNGIIENHDILKKKLETKKYSFKTQTDTEIVSALIDSFYEKDPIRAITKSIGKLEGSYALGILFKDIKDTIFAIAKNSPLIIGLGENENFLASDIPAIIKHTKKYIILEKNEIAILKKDSVKIVNLKGNPIGKDIKTVDWNIETTKKGGFSHYMLKEIFEQPEALKRCFNKRLLKTSVNFEIENLSPEKIKKIKKIHIVACGTAMHAGLIGKNIIENLTKIPVEVEVASEFRYKDPILNEHNLVILISQSGETADTLAALKLAKKRKIFTLAIVNVVASSIARQADSVFYTWAGPEFAVASTKAFTVQVAALYLISLNFAKILKKIKPEELKKYCEILNEIPKIIKKILKLNDEILKYAKIFNKAKNMFFIGRGLDCCLALEGSLKLKEISYIHSEAYKAGELKHGTISLIEKNTPVVVLASQSNLFSKTLTNAKEVIARGAKVLLICNENEQVDEKTFKYVLKLPKTIDFLAPLYFIVPLQLFAYHVALLKGCDIDKPRNLAKSVTVE